MVLVGWEDGARGPLYLLAATNTEMVGRMLGRFLLLAGVEARRVHAIGFSLGAMAAGHLGEFFKERGGKLGRISGEFSWNLSKFRRKTFSMKLN